MRATNKDQLLQLEGRSFDLMLGDQELGSGSVVNHRLDVQRRLLDVLGVSRAERNRIRYLLDAPRSGAPSLSGIGIGIGIGIDRLVAAMCGAGSIRDVMAFPKPKSGRCPVTDS